MAKFIIADLTDPRSLPQELATIVPYETTVELLANLGERVIGPAEQWLAAPKASG